MARRPGRHHPSNRSRNRSSQTKARRHSPHHAGRPVALLPAGATWREIAGPPPSPRNQIEKLAQLTNDSVSQANLGFHQAPGGAGDAPPAPLADPPRLPP